MKANKKLFIILLCVSVVIAIAGAVLAFWLEPEIWDTDGNIGAFIMLAGISLLSFAIINFVLKSRLDKRYNAVKRSFENLGEGIYVQGTCGNKAQDGADAAKNTSGFGGALLFASLFGTGVWAVHNSRTMLEFYIVGNDMYAGVFKLGLWGYEYNPVEDMRVVYKGWFARHTVEIKGKKIILTGADGQSYFSFDLNSCSADKEKLLAEITNVFGVATNAEESKTADGGSSPFGDL